MALTRRHSRRTSSAAGPTCLAALSHPFRCRWAPRLCSCLNLPCCPLPPAPLQVGNRAFAARFKLECPNSWALVNEQDPVPRVPGTGEPLSSLSVNMDGMLPFAQ